MESNEKKMKRAQLENEMTATKQINKQLITSLHQNENDFGPFDGFCALSL